MGSNTSNSSIQFVVGAHNMKLKLTVEPVMPHASTARTAEPGGSLEPLAAFHSWKMYKMARQVAPRQFRATGPLRASMS
jgi:hypothetical protein